MPKGTPTRDVTMEESLLIADPQKFINDVKYIIAVEMRRFKMKARAEKPLTLQESLMLRNYACTHIKITHEERNAQEFDRVNSLTENELRLLAANIISENPELQKIIMRKPLSLEEVNDES